MAEEITWEEALAQWEPTAEEKTYWLRLYDIVWNQDDPSRRGMVVWARGKGYAGPPMMGTINDHVIQLGPGHQQVTNNHDLKWQTVPRYLWTMKECVTHAYNTWTPWKPFPNDPPDMQECPEDETLEYYVMRAMRDHYRLMVDPSYDVMDVEYDYDEEHDFCDVARNVAEIIDEDRAGRINGPQYLCDRIEFLEKALADQIDINVRKQYQTIWAQAQLEDMLKLRLSLSSVPTDPAKLRDAVPNPGTMLGDLDAS